MPDLEHTLEQIQMTLAKILDKLGQSGPQPQPQPSGSPTLTVRLGNSPGATRQRWFEDAQLEGEFFFDEFDDFPGFSGAGFRPPRFSDRYLGGLNNLLGDTLEWVSNSADAAAGILRPPHGFLRAPGGGFGSPFIGGRTRRNLKIPRYR